MNDYQHKDMEEKISELFMTFCTRRNDDSWLINIASIVIY